MKYVAWFGYLPVALALINNALHTWSDNFDSAIIRLLTLTLACIFLYIWYSNKDDKPTD